MMCLPIIRIIMNDNRIIIVISSWLLSIQQGIVRAYVPYEANLRGEGVGVVELWVYVVEYGIIILLLYRYLKKLPPAKTLTSYIL